MEEGFEKAQSYNLPRVDVFMVAQYLAENSDSLADEIRGMKSERVGYGDDAFGYVQLKRDGDICTVKCRITPEHRVRVIRVKPYRCTLTCNENDGQILSIACEDCAASKSGCRHTVAFLMWLHRRTEEPSTTSVKCYWKTSTPSGIRTSLKFIKAKDFGDLPTDDVEICDSNSFFDKITEKLRQSEINCQLSAYITSDK